MRFPPKDILLTYRHSSFIPVCYDIYSKYSFIFTENLPCTRHYSLSRCQDRVRDKTDENRQKSFLSQTLHSESNNPMIPNLIMFTCKHTTNGDFFFLAA